MSRVAGFPCASCRGHRLHAIRVHKRDNGEITRVRICSACSTITDLTYLDRPAGVVCPVCCHIRLNVLYTRFRQGSTIRVKQCGHCGHCVRTVEKFEAVAHKSRGRSRPRRPCPV